MLKDFTMRMVVINKILAVALAFCFWISYDSVKAQEFSSPRTSYWTYPSSSPYNSSGDDSVKAQEFSSTRTSNWTYPSSSPYTSSGYADGETGVTSTLENYSGYSTGHNLDSLKEKCHCRLEKEEMYYIIFAALGGTVLGIFLAVLYLRLVMDKPRKSEEATSEEGALHGVTVDEASKRAINETNGGATNQATGETNGEATNQATSEPNGEALTPVAGEST